jgi:hypothetical protein
MIMKKPIIIAHSGFQGFCDCGELRVRKSQRLVARAGPDPARPVAPGVRGVAVVIHPTSFRVRSHDAVSPYRPDNRPVEPIQVVHHAGSGKQHGDRQSARTVADIQPALFPVRQ